jgi:excisionase family DNA binding protein
MGLILLIVGAVLFYTGKVNFGSFQAEGRQVKAAGVILMLPEGIAFLLSIFMLISFGSNPNVIGSMVSMIAVLQLGGMFIALAIAYLLIANPPNAPRLPGILGDIQKGIPANSQSQSASKTPAEKLRNEEPEQETTSTTRQPEVINFVARVQQLPQQPAQVAGWRDKFPPVMDTKQAARYLQVTEEYVMELIDQGKLAAARNNYRYQIAKSQLDDLLENGGDTV